MVMLSTAPTERSSRNCEKTINLGSGSFDLCSCILDKEEVWRRQGGGEDAGDVIQT